MKFKSVILFVLIAATLFALSCGKKPTGTDSQTPTDETIVIPEGVTFAPVEQGSLYYLVQGQKYAGEELVIPSRTADGYTVTQIGSFGFWKLTNLKKVTIPYPIEKINASAFEGCTALTEIDLPSSVERIGPSAFEGCTALTSVKIPYSVYLIASDAFKGCTALSEIAFNGTMSGWNDILKPQGDSSWIEPDKTITIHCTDGDIVINGK